MSEPSSGPRPYQVVYSDRVREELRGLADRAIAAGLGRPFLVALREFDRLLHRDPQFGEPLRDLELEPARLWIGGVSPLVLRYSVDDDRRVVMVVSSPMLLPRSGI